MCGIAGWIDHSQDMSEKIDLLNRISETLDRRGPDENGPYPAFRQSWNPRSGRYPEKFRLQG